MFFVSLGQDIRAIVLFSVTFQDSKYVIADKLNINHRNHRCGFLNKIPVYHQIVEQ
jgi:hypothetical protein